MQKNLLTCVRLNIFEAATQQTTYTFLLFHKTSFMLLRAVTVEYCVRKFVLLFCGGALNTLGRNTESYTWLLLYGISFVLLLTLTVEYNVTKFIMNYLPFLSSYSVFSLPLVLSPFPDFFFPVFVAFLLFFFCNCEKIKVRSPNVRISINDLFSIFVTVQK